MKQKITNNFLLCFLLTQQHYQIYSYGGSDISIESGLALEVLGAQVW